MKGIKASFGDSDGDSDDDEANVPAPSTSKRHFAASTMRKSGPGSLGPRPSDGRKPFGLGPSPSSRSDSPQQRREAKPTTSTAKPVLELTCLPPGITDLKLRHVLGECKLIPDTIRIVDPDDLESTNKQTDKKSLSALAFFDSETSSRDLDEFVAKFCNHYIGMGYYMFAQRADSNNYRRIPTHSSMRSNLFGATIHKPPPQQYAASQNGPHKGGIAPPESFQPHSKLRSARNVDEPVVHVKVPKDYAQLQLIHRTIAEYLAQPAAEKQNPGSKWDVLAWEKKFMNNPVRQNNESYAWLYDARSVGGVYYRWRLWEMTTGYIRTEQRNKWHKTEEERLHKLYEGPDQPLWREPDHIPFEFCNSLEELAQDPAYESSDLDENDDEGMPLPKHWEMPSDRPDFLNKYEAAKLLFWFEKLPKSHTQLTRGDVMVITDFACDHAGLGGWQVSERLVENVLWPYNVREDPDMTREETKKKDNSGSQLIGLYVITDVLANCVEAEARLAWRFRPELSEALLKTHAFRFLGKIPQKFKYGRISEDRWRNQVSAVLAKWSDDSMFDAGPLAEMKAEFEEGLNWRKEADKSKSDLGDEVKESEGASGGRWLAVGGNIDSAEDSRMEGS